MKTDKAALIGLFEAKYNWLPPVDRTGEMLEIARFLYDELAEHDAAVRHGGDDPRTQKDLLFLLADYYSRFKSLKAAAFREGLIPSRLAFDRDDEQPPVEFNDDGTERDFM